MRYNINYRTVSDTSIEVRAYYRADSGDPTARFVNFYCDDDWFASENYPSDGRNWTTEYYTKTDLKPDTWYDFHALFRTAGYADITYTQTISVKTAPPERNPPPSPYQVWISSVTSTTADVRWDEVYDAQNYEVYVDDGYSHRRSTVYGSYTTVTGLNPDSEYRVGVVAKNRDGESRITWSSWFYTDPEPLSAPTISVDGQTYSSVTLNVRSTGATSYETQYRSNKNYTWTNYWDDIYNPIVVTGLQEGLTYDFRVRAVKGDEKSPYSRTVTVNIGRRRPEDWRWQYNIRSGGTFYSQSSKTAYVMQASHWNGFTRRINDFREYKGLGQYSFTNATTSSNVRTCLNQAIDALNPMVDSRYRMGTVGSGEVVTARVFNNLIDNMERID